MTVVPGARMFTIEKTFSFDSAHFLPRVPEGHKCRRMHGHTYSVTVRVRSESLDDVGMVLDYGELSKAAKPLVEELDHRVLNEIEGLENPTAEVISRWIYERLKVALPDLDSVVVKETPATSSEYRRNGLRRNAERNSIWDVAGISEKDPRSGEKLRRWIGDLLQLQHRKAAKIQSRRSMPTKPEPLPTPILDSRQPAPRPPAPRPPAPRQPAPRQPKSPAPVQAPVAADKSSRPRMRVARPGEIDERRTPWVRGHGSDTWHRSGGGWRKGRHEHDENPGLRRNSDDELRELERACRRTGAADDAVRLARALLRHGRDRVDTTAFMRRCGVSPVEAHEMVAEATGVPLVEWKLINYGVNGDEENGWEINDLHYTGETIQLPADATHSEVRDALVDERIIRAGLEVDSEASSETNVVFRRPSDQRPVGALERAARGNPGDEQPVHVRPDGTTTCCNAYSTISADDQVEYCKKCYRAVEGYLDEAVFALPTRVDVAAGHPRCEACSRATGTETRHPMDLKCRRRPRRR